VGSAYANLRGEERAEIDGAVAAALKANGFDQASGTLRLAIDQ
jgi:hypothetical protein